MLRGVVNFIFAMAFTADLTDTQHGISIIQQNYAFYLSSAI